MTTRSYPAIARFAVAGLFGLTASATACDNLPTTIKSPTSAQFDIDITTNSTPELGKLKICKSGNIGGSFTFVREQFGDGSLPGYLANFLANRDIPSGLCIVVGEDNGGDQVGSRVRITELGGDLVNILAEAVNQEVDSPDITFSSFNFVNGGEVFVNIFHGVTITFVNTHVAPQVCDFITFGRLVTEVNGQKVVISGNAGGNKPGGGILGEFHIEANGVDNHVADIDSYEPAGALLNLENARIVKGTAKNGVAVELRLWDGGEPGKDTDRVWVKLGNTVLIGGALGQFIDQGNMQFHNVCRGPGDASLN